MKPKTKRIVAREGLIIIALIFLAGITFFLDYRLDGLKNLYVVNVKEISPYIHNEPTIPADKDQKHIAPEVPVAPSGGGGLMTRDQRLFTREELESRRFDFLDLDELPNTTFRIDGQEVILRFPKHTDNTIIKQTIRRDFLNTEDFGFIVWDYPKSKNINASYDEKGNLVFNSIIYKIEWIYVCVFFLIFAYPLYLLMRFIIWSIVTLRKI